MRILVTGGTGSLGSVIVAQLTNSSHTPRILSRSLQPVTAGIEQAQGAIATGAGLAEALQNVDAVIHAASSGRDTYEVDVIGTQHLLHHARQQGVKHFVFVSIIGIDRIPLPYYQSKLAAELAIVESGVPYTLARISQFHEFVDARLQPLKSIEESPLQITTDAQFQTIDLQDAARYLIETATAAPGSTRTNIAGPEILTAGAMAATWLAAQGIDRPIEHALPPEAHVGFMEGMRHGYNTTPGQAYGRITWAEFLKSRYGKS